MLDYTTGARGGKGLKKNKSRERHGPCYTRKCVHRWQLSICTKEKEAPEGTMNRIEKKKG